ncbi:hypothetical protein O3M35_004100 [Rhynocoris fuscipes]|uniref:Uncharacterized protein n=1 Tax=Rhynocoris fuscipes TaxID=488301 RepID=A0AAW1CIB8_9HEMI
MGRGPFFGGSRKMRGFPMNLSPGGLDDPPPGFPYFGSEAKFEFGYPGPQGFHHEFFPGHHAHGPPPPQAFNPSGKILKYCQKNFFFFFLCATTFRTFPNMKNINEENTLIV